MDVRERVFSALRELSRSRGLHGVTMDELAQAAGVSKRTIYRHFPGKEQVIEEMTDRLLLQVEERVDGVLAGIGRPRDKLRHLITGVYQMISFLELPALAELPKQYPGLWHKVDAFRSEKILRLEGLIAEGIACGDFRRVDPAAAAAAVLGMVRTIINPAFILNHSLSIAEAFQTVFELFLYGVAAPPADGDD